MQRLTVSGLVDAIAETSGLTAEQVRSVLRAQAAVVYEHVTRGDQVPLPGLGVVEREEKRTADTMVLTGPSRGTIIPGPAVKKLRIMVSSVAADVILKGEKPPSDVLKLNPFTGFRPKRNAPEPFT